MVKVLFIAYHFPPVGGAGVQRTQKFVQHLPAEGFLPIVVTGPGSAEDRWTPRDASLLTEVPASVPVHRVKEPVPGSPNKWQRRLSTWLGLPSPFSKWWIPKATELACQTASDAHLIFATMSPFESAVVASRVSKRLRIPWVADLRDPWALDEMQVYPTLVHRKLAQRGMERLLSTASLIVMNTPEATAALRATFPRLRNKEILTITNGFDQEDFAAPVAPRTDSKFRIVHTGYLHTDVGLQLRKRRFYRLLGGAVPGVDILTRSHAILLEAIERWCAQRPDVNSDLEIVFAGKISDEDRALAEKSGISSLIRFIGYVSHSESLQLIRTADVLFLPMHNLPRGRRSTIIPGKVYEYMASGRPILAAVPEGDARDYLLQCGSGLVSWPDDTDGMMRILEGVYGAWKTGQCITAPDISFIAQFERRILTRALAGGFQALLSAPVDNVGVGTPRHERVSEARGTWRSDSAIPRPEKQDRPWQPHLGRSDQSEHRQGMQGAVPHHCLENGVTVYEMNPIQDPRWKRFLERHPQASVFHTPGWLEALRRTYGYEPIVLTTSPSTMELTNGIVFCRIRSWLTGHRLVSLPFSDHCEPLVADPEDLRYILGSLEGEEARKDWKYIEIRPLSSALECPAGFGESQAFYFHKLDLRPSSDELFRSFHKDCVQRKIRRAERECLTYEEGRAEALLDAFYHLLLLTRRRQQLPPHPLNWFRNLIDCLGDQVKIRVASKGGRPVASILTLSYKGRMVYKYGCSDARFNNLGAMHFLFWKTIQEAKDRGLQEFDLGRSDCDNPGLVAFKDRWGGTRSMLTYARYPARRSPTSSDNWEMQIAKRLFARMPDGLLATAGKLLYRHMG